MIYPWLLASFEHLHKRAIQNTLHHGLLIFGPQGVGKSEFSKELANSLLCSAVDKSRCGSCQSCKLYSAQSHPDLYRIETEKQVGVDLVRDAINKLNTTAQLSGNKVLIIENADTMTDAAANALLKTLEEPTDNTFLLLICDKTEGLLPTIKSRCEKVPLACSNSDQCLAWLSEQGFDSPNSKLIELYKHSPLTLLSHLQKKEGLTFEGFMDSLMAIHSQQKTALQLAEEWQIDAHQIVHWMQNWVSEQIKLEPRNSELYWQFDASLRQHRQGLKNPGVNRVLILSAILDRFKQLPLS